jgi:hypothetical protein
VAPAGRLTLWVETADHKPAATPVIEISRLTLDCDGVKARARDLRAAAIFGSGQNACPIDESNGR